LPPLATRQATVAGGCVVLNFLLQLQTSPATTHAGYEKTNLAWLAKCATDRKMLSLVVARSFRLHHINLSKKAIFW